MVIIILSEIWIRTKYESMVSLVSRRYMRVVNGSLLVGLSTFTYCINPRDKTKSMFRKEITNRVESIEATTPLWSPIQSALLRRLLTPETETCQCLWHHHSIGLT